MASDNVDAMLSLTRAAVSDERCVLPLLLKGVGTQFFELVPTARWSMLELDPRHSRNLKAKPYKSEYRRKRTAQNVGSGEKNSNFSVFQFGG